MLCLKEQNRSCVNAAGIVRLEKPKQRRPNPALCFLPFGYNRKHVSLKVVASFPGCPHHAGPAADPRTDCHVAPRAATEHPHPQRADSEDCRRCAMTAWQRKTHSAVRWSFCLLPSRQFSSLMENSVIWKHLCIVTQQLFFIL